MFNDHTTEHQAREEKSRKEEEKSRLVERKKELEAERGRLKELEKKVAGYASGGDFYMRVTSQGEKLREQLALSKEGLKEISLLEFLQRESLMVQVLDAQFIGFEDLRRFFVAKDSFDDDEATDQLVLAVMDPQGESRDILNKVRPLIDWLDGELSFSDNSGLYRVAASLLLLPSGTGAENRTAFRRMADFAVGDREYDDDDETYWESAMVLHLPGERGEQFERFDAMDEALSQAGWERRSKNSCYLASYLSQREGDPVAIVQEHRRMAQALTKSGKEDVTATAVAAMILMNHPGNNEERVSAFNAVWEILEKEEKEDADTDLYPTAAALALLPGTPEEKIYYFKRAKKDIVRSSNSYGNMDAMAIVFLMRAYARVYPEVFASRPFIGFTKADAFGAVLLWDNISSLLD